MKKAKQKSGRKTLDWRNADPYHEREARKYDHPAPSREYILSVLDRREGPLTEAELMDLFDLKQEDEQEALRHRLRAMERDGQVARNRRNAFGPIERMDLVRGTVIGHRDGYGFLQTEDGSADVFMPPRQMRSLMHGDRALVRVVRVDERNRREGALVSVLERNTETVVGRFMRESGVGFVAPDNPRLSQDVIIPDGEHGGARTGQIVTARITQQPGKRNQPIGRIVEVLGEHMAPGMEVDIAIRAHNLPFEWPQAVGDEVEPLGDEVDEAHKEGRVDLRNLPLVTIDGEDARDFDDAVCARPTPNGWKLWVAIADVSAYVKPGTALDEEANNRGTSVYFPNQVIPMLPEQLSNGLCSLNPEVDRLCMVCEMQVRRDGQVLRSRFYEAVMRSHARFTYTEVARILDDESVAGSLGRDGLLPQLRALRDVYHALLQARVERGAIDFESSEVRMLFDEQRKIRDVVPVERTEAHRLIEECMVAANVQAARFLARRRLPTLYRVHNGPTSERLESLRAFLTERGLRLGGGLTPEPADYAALLDRVRGRPDAHLIQTVLLRSLAQAVYTPDNQGHFGLALEHYAHFTSPIRRYPDLLVHRGIKHALNGGKAAGFDYSLSEMEGLGAHCSGCERRADEATRDAMDWLKCEFMQDRVGETFQGQITGVAPFGLFVEVEGLHVEGLVHVSSLNNDYYHYEADHLRLRGERTGRTYRLADKMRIQVMRVDLDQRKIDFAPAESAAGRSQRRRSSSRKRRS